MLGLATIEIFSQLYTLSRMMSQPLVVFTGSPTDIAKVNQASRPSFLAVSRGIYLRDGVRGFFRGLGPTFLRAFPVNASAFFVYEGMMRLMGAEQVCFLNSTHVQFC